MEIAAIKQHLSIQTVLDHYGLKPDRHGMIKCPFHDDHTPSLKIYPKTHTFHCFGCDKNGDAIEFCSLKEGDKHKGILKAGELSGLPTARQPVKKNASFQKTNSNNHSRILTSVFTIFKHGLHAAVAKRPRAYLESRGLDPTLLEVGYNSGQFHHRGKLPEDDRQACIDAGLLIPYHGTVPKVQGISYTAFAKDCIIFPLKDKQNQIVSLYGRSIQEEKKAAGSPQAGKHFYLKNRSGLYPSYPLPETTRLILTEAIIDAASLLQIPEITEQYSILACYGTNGLTAEHQQAIKNLPYLEEIVLMLDGDQEGQKATARHAGHLQEMLPGVRIMQVILPDGEDINSLHQLYDNEDYFLELLEKRSPAVPENNKTSVKQEDIQLKKKAEMEGNLEKLTQNGHETADPAAKNTSNLNTENPTFSQLSVENPQKIIFTTSTARYTVKGGLRKELDSLRISLDITHPENNLKYRAKVDLYEDVQLVKAARQASEKLGLRADLLEMDLGRLTDQLEAYREKHLLEPDEPRQRKVTIPPETVKTCIAFLKKPDLLNRLNNLIGRSGVVGEEQGRLFLFILASSYKMPQTLHALIQGSSGSGKTRLLAQTALCMPPEDVIRFTRVTDSSLYNYPEYFFINRLVCFEDIDGLKEEAQYAVRELISNEILTSSTSVKDENGNISARQKTVRGPMASLSATTHGQVYEDNISRLFIVAVDEAKEQTERVIRYQQQKAAGVINTEKENQASAFLQNCIRLLKAHAVINPFSDQVQLPEGVHKRRRLNELFLACIRQITLLHQYQRKKDDQGRLVTALEDVEAATEIMFESIWLKVDELDGSLRQFYEQLKTYVKSKTEPEQYEFTQREVRHALHISKTQLHRYIMALMELEYLRQSGGYANRGFTYRIIYWDDMTALREKIRNHLQWQIKAIKKNDH